MRPKRKYSLIVAILLLHFAVGSAGSQSAPLQPHLVQPGDTWAALALGYNISEEKLRSLFPHVNTMRQPPIGATIMVPTGSTAVTGRLVRSNNGGLLQLTAVSEVSLWSLAIRNDIANPYRPLLLRPVLIPDGGQPRDLPPHFSSLEVSHLVAHPGEAIGIRGQSSRASLVKASLDDLFFDVFTDEESRLVGLASTGAFYGSREPELTIRVAGAPLWTQPWRFEDKEWTYQQITLTGDAAAIDQASITRERERLLKLWSQVSSQPQWSRPFQLPVQSYLEISSQYGARRSYNGGPYRTYHEGVDFSAYGGTDVLAAADGTVVLAEILYVRGGAVIIDHGLGIYSGYYHMSAVDVSPGDKVTAGQRIGAVGTTGLSTGNHLHWDLLVGGTWVDAAAWRDQGMGCWILAGFGRSCLVDN